MTENLDVTPQRTELHLTVRKCKSEAEVTNNKCIGDYTKAAARQRPNCIKKIKYGENNFQYGGWNYYTLQCGMWLWNHDSKFTKWQHPAV